MPKKHASSPLPPAVVEIGDRVTTRHGAAGTVIGVLVEAAGLDSPRRRYLVQHSDVGLVDYDTSLAEWVPDVYVTPRRPSDGGGDVAGRRG